LGPKRGSPVVRISLRSEVGKTAFVPELDQKGRACLAEARLRLRRGALDRDRVENALQSLVLCENRQLCALIFEGNVRAWGRFLSQLNINGWVLRIRN